MTYFAFLGYFVLIPIVLLGIVTWRDQNLGRPLPGFYLSRVPAMIGLHVLLALVYTTPWDNYLVATGVWTYNPALVTGLTIGYVPIEEYTFFILETILSGLWWLALARRLGLPSPRQFQRSPGLVLGASVFAGLAWMFFTWQFFSGADPWNYLGIIFFWALPAIFPQLLFGADILWHYRKLVFWAIFVPGLYLSLTDVIALSETTWQISKSQTLGINFFNVLPLEEVVFFFITNVLIGFGLTLMLSESGWERFNDWKKRRFQGMP